MTITFFNQKGGVGKTTGSALFIDYLAKKGFKVLGIDLDPQPSLSETYFQLDHLKTLPSMVSYLSKIRTLESCITKVSDNIDFIPAHESMANLPAEDSAYLPLLKLDFTPIFKRYEYIVIDTKPSLHWLSRLGIKLANYVLMPNYMDAYSKNSLSGALLEVELMKSSDFKACYVFENRKASTQKGEQTNHRDGFKDTLGGTFLEKGLVETISIQDRASYLTNYFDLKTAREKEVLEFFDYLVERLV